MIACKFCQHGNAKFVCNEFNDFQNMKNVTGAFFACLRCGRISYFSLPQIGRELDKTNESIKAKMEEDANEELGSADMGVKPGIANSDNAVAADNSVGELTEEAVAELSGKIAEQTFSRLEKEGKITRADSTDFNNAIEGIEPRKKDGKKPETYPKKIAESSTQGK